MNWILVFVFFLLIPQAAKSAEIKSPDDLSHRYEPYDMTMGVSALKFLNGSWSYTDKHVRVIETWATNNDAESIGIRRRLRLPGKASDEIYDVFTFDGGMRIRRMDMHLINVGKSGIVSCSSDCKNKVSIVQMDDPTKEDPLKHSISQKINYASPNDNELDLEIISTENGKDTREFYKLTRTR